MKMKYTNCFLLLQVKGRNYIECWGLGVEGCWLFVGVGGCWMSPLLYAAVVGRLTNNKNLIVAVGGRLTNNKFDNLTNNIFNQLFCFFISSHTSIRCN